MKEIDYIKTKISMEIPQRVLMIFRAEALNVAKNTFKGCNVQYTKFEDLAGLLTAEIMHLGLGMY